MVKITSLLVLSFSVLIFLTYGLLLLFCVTKEDQQWAYILDVDNVHETNEAIIFTVVFKCISDPNKVMIFILSEVLDLFSDMIWKDNNKIITFGVKNCSYRHVVHILVGL